MIPGSEDYLEAGITDYLNIEGINVLGPTKEAAKLESSKIYTWDTVAEQFIDSLIPVK